MASRARFRSFPWSLFHKLTSCNSVILKGYSPVDATLSLVTSSLGSHWSNLAATDHCDWSSHHNYTELAGPELEFSILSLLFDNGFGRFLGRLPSDSTVVRLANHNSTSLTTAGGLTSLTKLAEKHENHQNLLIQQ